MLEGHVEFLARASIEAALRLHDSYADAGGRIEDNPLLFPFADHLDAPSIPSKTYRKCLFEERYKAVFRMEEGGEVAAVVAIIDCRMGNKGVV
jgi:hypothetical protein